MATLPGYQTATRNLLQNPGSSSTGLYDTTSLSLWINTARAQVAGESESIRALGTISTAVGTRNYAFASLNIGVVASTGRAGVFNVRELHYTVGSGQQYVTPRAWPWFNFYHLNNPVPDSGPPAVWSQFAQGMGASFNVAGGSFYVDPLPDLVYTLTCDCVCYPVVLLDDTTVEALPYPWTDAVPFLAAYYALLSSQTSQRQADAARMYEAYQEFVARARRMSNPSVNRGLYQQAADQTQINKLGLQQRAAGGGG